MKIIRDHIESYRYTNHLWPVLILRFYLSFYFFSLVTHKRDAGFLDQPLLSAMVDQNLSSWASVPGYLEFLFTGFFQKNWELVSYLMLQFEWVLGLLFLIGFLNRPASLLAIFYLLVFSYIQPVEAWQGTQAVIFMLMATAFFGSGRVAGLDYTFYRGQRGLLW